MTKSRSRSRKNVPCYWCERPLYSSNNKRHWDTCIYKNEIGMTKSDFMYIKNKFGLNIKSERKDEATILEMKTFLTDLYGKISSLYKRLIVEDGRDPIEKIDEMNVSKPTKKNYIREWKLFEKWLTSNNKSLSKESANTYISSLECKDSTQKRKHLTLQVLMQHIFDPSIKLNKFKKRVEYKPKKAFENEELKEYLAEQKSLNIEDFLIQILMATYGLRINTIAQLKKSHLEFLKAQREEGKVIHFPDSKTKNKRAEKIDPEISNQLKDFVKDKLSDDYVFYSDGKKLDIVRRSRDLSVRITKRLKSSKVIEKDPNYQLSSHVFRKSRVFQEYHEGINKLKEKARKDLGQISGSQALEHYI